MKKLRCPECGSRDIWVFDGLESYRACGKCGNMFVVVPKNNSIRPRKGEIRMRNGERLLSREQFDGRDGVFINRVINSGGVRYTAIEIDGCEMYSCPTDEEEQMLDWFKGECDE